MAGKTSSKKPPKQLTDGTIVCVIGGNRLGQFGLGINKPILRLKFHTSPQILTDVMCGNQYLIFINNKKQYFAAGRNSSGQCGIGNFSSPIISLKAIKYFEENNIKISKICVSLIGASTFWISTNKKLYANGWNECYNLGIGNNKRNKKKPVLVNQLKRIIDVKSSWNYSLALYNMDIDGVINWFFRVNNINNMYNDIIDVIKLFYGIPNYVYTTLNDGEWSIINALNNAHIIKIDMSNSTAFFVSSTGILWYCKGKPKPILNKYILTFSYFIKEKIKIKDIACGCSHYLTIDYNENIWSWGNNKHGQCGPGSKTTEPSLIETFKYVKIAEMCCGGYHSYVQTIGYQHYLFGDNNYGQCLKNTKNDVKTPFLINGCFKKPIKHVRCGRHETIIVLYDY